MLSFPVVDGNDFPRLRFPLEPVTTGSFSSDALERKDVNPHPRHVEDLV